MRIRLDLAYDGTDFAGWATQPGLRTVQGTLEEALARVTRLEEPRLTVAGRTDAGVHARGQVAHLDLPEEAWAALPGRSDRDPGRALTHRLNAVLPGDVVLHAAAPAPEGFDARFSATWRRYSYTIAGPASAADPLRRHQVLAVRGELDEAAMDAAAATLRGERDFAPFCKPRVGASTVRTLLDYRWERDARGDLVAFVLADAFCHSMVRSLVGAALAVGQGRRDLAWLERIAAAGSRAGEIQVAPPHPLVLEEVGYPGAEHLAARAVQARAVRGPRHGIDP